MALLVRDAATVQTLAERLLSVHPHASSSPREWDATALSTLLVLAAVLTSSAFLLLVGSDPGYLNEGELFVKWLWLDDKIE